MLNDALSVEILGARALAYRRGALGLGVTLSAIYWHPTVKLDDLTLLGLGLPTGEGRELVVSVLWIFLTYHVFMFGYYAWRDYRLWIGNALSGDSRGYPELQMFFGSPPLRAEHRAQPSGCIPEPNDWRHEVSGGKLVWMPPPAEHPHSHINNYEHLKRAVAEFKEKFVWFLCSDIGLPFGVVYASIVLRCWSDPACCGVVGSGL